MYKGFPVNRDYGYFAREFDLVAAKPGIDWTGEVSDWLNNAHAKGWVTKTSPLEAKPGALLIGYTYPAGLWIGIVRAVTADEIRYDTLDPQGKLVSQTKTCTALRKEKVVMGYIWPEKNR